MGKKNRRRGTARPAKGSRGSSGGSRSAALAVAGRGRSSGAGAAIDPLAASAKLLKSSGGRDIDLRGIISTNDDPFACAKCLAPLMRKSDRSVMVISLDCCGKMVCKTCLERKYTIIADLFGQCRCAMCNTPYSLRQSAQDQMRQLLRDQAHLGHPYAQYQFAPYVSDEYPQSATVWMEKAAAQGHPDAFISLSESSRIGYGCERNLQLARQYAERAKELHVAYAPLANTQLAIIAVSFLDEGSESIARDIVNCLLCHQFDDKVNPAGEVAIDHVCCEQLAPLLQRLEYCDDQIRLIDARKIKMEIQHGIVTPMQYAIYAADAGALAFANFFLNYIVSTGAYVDEESWGETKSRRVEIRRSLRELRRKCGGCGASLRACPKKICNGCRTHSYCDRRCQKKHWNRSKKGHRDECLGVKCLRESFGVE